MTSLSLASVNDSVIARQLKAVDASYTHDDFTIAHETTGWVNIRDVRQPWDWTAPVDYLHGFTYLRYELSDFSGEKLETRLWAMWDDGQLHAADENITITKPGAYYRRFRNSDLQEFRYGDRLKFDWKHPCNLFMLDQSYIAAKTRGACKVTAFIVPDGQKFISPPDWDCPAEWGCFCAKDITPPHATAALRAALDKGELGRAWVFAEKDAASKKPEIAESGRRVRAALTEYLDEEHAYIRLVKATDPLWAADELNRLAGTFANSPPGSELAREAAGWDTEASVVDERKARVGLEMIRRQVMRLAKTLDGRRVSDVTGPGGHTQVAGAIAAAALALRQEFPDAPSTQRALQIVSSMGITDTRFDFPGFRSTLIVGP